MRASSRSLVSPVMTIGLILAAVLAPAIILLAPNITITNAQQQQQPLIIQPATAVSQNGIKLFESTQDSFRMQVPRGWIIHDVNNTGSMFSEESRQGYGILAQLCPQEQQQRAALSNNVSNGGRGGGNTVRCQRTGGDIIHIVRYPDLDTRLQAANNITTANNNVTIDNILSYHMQKLEEVGYRGIRIVNSTNTALNVTAPQTNQTIATVPAKFVEIAYSTVSTPNVIREGYFISTATNTTTPNPGMTKGYTIFYEGSSVSAAAGAATAATIQQTTAAPSVSLAVPILPPLPPAVQQIFDSFELIAAPEVAQEMLTAQSEQAQQEVVGEEEPTTSPLTVDITSSDREGGRIAPATFEFEADVTGGTEPYTYRWTFGDDDSSTGESDEDEIISHTFEEAGRYNIRAIVTDSADRTVSDSIRITVEEASSLGEPAIREPSAQREDFIREDNLPLQQAQSDSAPPIAATQEIPAEQLTAQDNNQGGEQEETTLAPNLTQSIQQDASQNTQVVGIPNSNQGGEATEPYTSSLDFNSGASSSEERSRDDDDKNVDHIFDEAGSDNGDRTVTDIEDQRISDSVESKVEEHPEESQEEQPSTEEIPAEQLTAGEVKPDLSDAGNNNSGSDDLIDVDDVFDVDEFIDDLSDKLDPITKSHLKPEPPLTEQFKNQDQCIREANTNPNSGITKEACEAAFKA